MVEKFSSGLYFSVSLKLWGYSKLSQNLICGETRISKAELDRTIDTNQVVLIELEYLKDRLRTSSEKKEIDRIVARVLSSSRMLADCLRD